MRINTEGVFEICIFITFNYPYNICASGTAVIVEPSLNFERGCL